jgi:hypothetical protein
VNLDKKKKIVELHRVQGARMEMELKIDERKEEIRRLEENIKIQTSREKELEEEIERT